MAPEADVTDWGLSAIGRSRAEAFAANPALCGVSAIWASAERKATETAECISAALGLEFQTDLRLGENDRSATGFLAPEVFEAAADAFFADPDVSFRGWERAVDAQARIIEAVRGIVAAHKGGDLAIVSHGAVGTLLWCDLMDVAISRTHDQPRQGHYWRAPLDGLVPRSGWVSIG